MDRRTFLAAAGLGAAALTVAQRTSPATTARPLTRETSLDEVRAEFDLEPDWIHLAHMFIASHPRQVKEAIERHRRGLDLNPALYLLENNTRLRMETVREAAGYFGASEANVALTDSTTMSLALLYNGLRLAPGDELITTTRDYYSTRVSLRYVTERTGAKLIRVRLARPHPESTPGPLVDAIAQALTPRTRAVALTWVHSDSGLAFPIRQVAELLREENRSRSPKERILLGVDGVHGFGVKDVDLGELGCDFFAAGCHKWLFGPRGTGVLYAGSKEVWSRTLATIPPFGAKHTPGLQMTPGGFKPFEHQWALAEAFRFHRALGRDRIAGRIRELATRLKLGLLQIPGVTLLTPLDPALSAGIVSFTVAGMSSRAVVAALVAQRFVVTQAPYGARAVRVTPGFINTTSEIDALLEAVRRLT